MPRRGDGDEEAAVEPRVARAARAVADALIQFHASASIARYPAGTWSETDLIDSPATAQARDLRVVATFGSTDHLPCLSHYAGMRCSMRAITILLAALAVSPATTTRGARLPRSTSSRRSRHRRPIEHSTQSAPDCDHPDNSVVPGSRCSRPALDLVVTTATTTCSLDSATFRLLDGTNVGGSPITIPQTELVSMFGSTRVAGSALSFSGLSSDADRTSVRDHRKHSAGDPSGAMSNFSVSATF